MKKTFLLTLCIFLFTSLLSAALLFADIVPPNSEYVDKCVKIANLKQFPDAILLGYIDYVSDGYNIYVVENDKCLTKGYKFNRLHLYWTPREYVDSVGVENIKVEPVWIENENHDSGGYHEYQITDENVHLLLENVDVTGGYVTKGTKVSSEEEYYAIYSEDDELKLYLSEKVTIYKDGNKNVASYAPPVPTSNKSESEDKKK